MESDTSDTDNDTDETGMEGIQQDFGPYVERLSPSSPDALKLLERINLTNVDPEFRDRYWSIAAVYSVKNDKLFKTFSQFKKDLTASGRQSEPLNDVLMFSNETRRSVQEISRNGCRSSGRKGRVLGDAGSGVHLVRHYDILSRFLAYRQRGAPCFIMVQKAVLGKAKPIVPRDAKGDSVAPYPGFDCHVSASSVQAKQPIINAYKCSQVFFYELDDATSKTVDYPRQILPHAIIELEKKHPIRIESPFLAVGLKQSLWEVKGETRRGFRFVLTKVKDRNNKIPLTRKRKLESVKTNLKDQLLEMRTRWPEACTAAKFARLQKDPKEEKGVEHTQTRKRHENDTNRNKGSPCVSRTRFNRAAKPLPLSLKPFVLLQRLPPPKYGSIKVAALPEYQGKVCCNDNGDKDDLTRDKAALPKPMNTKETEASGYICSQLTGNYSSGTCMLPRTREVGENLTEPNCAHRHKERYIHEQTESSTDGSETSELLDHSINHNINTKKTVTHTKNDIEKRIQKQQTTNVKRDGQEGDKCVSHSHSKQDIKGNESNKTTDSCSDTCFTTLPDAKLQHIEGIGTKPCLDTRQVMENFRAVSKKDLNKLCINAVTNDHSTVPINSSKRNVPNTAPGETLITKENKNQETLHTKEPDLQVSGRPKSKDGEIKASGNINVSVCEPESTVNTNVLSGPLDNAAKTRVIQENNDDRRKESYDKEFSSFKPLRASHSTESMTDFKTKSSANVQKQRIAEVSKHTVEPSTSFDSVTPDRLTVSRPCFDKLVEDNCNIKLRQEQSKDRSPMLDTKTSFFKPFLKSSETKPQSKSIIHKVSVPNNNKKGGADTTEENKTSFFKPFLNVSPSLTLNETTFQKVAVHKPSQESGTNKSEAAISCKEDKTNDIQTLKQPRTKETSGEDILEKKSVTRSGVYSDANETSSIKPQRTNDYSQNNTGTSIATVTKQNPTSCKPVHTGLAQTTFVDAFLPDRVVNSTPHTTISSEVKSKTKHTTENPQNVSKTDNNETSFFKPFLKATPQVNQNIECSSVTLKALEKRTFHDKSSKAINEQTPAVTLLKPCTNTPSTSSTESLVLNLSSTKSVESTSFFKTFLNVRREGDEAHMDRSSKQVSTEKPKHQHDYHEPTTVSHKTVDNIPSTSPPIADIAPTTMDTNPVVYTSKTCKTPVSVSASVGNAITNTITSQPATACIVPMVPCSSMSTDTHCLVRQESPPKDLSSNQQDCAQLVTALSDNLDNGKHGLGKDCSQKNSLQTQKVHPPFTREFFDTQQGTLSNDTSQQLTSHSDPLSTSCVTAENPSVSSVFSANAIPLVSSSGRSTNGSSVSSDTQATNTECLDNPLAVLKSRVTVDENTAKRIQQFLFQQISLKTNKKPDNSEQGIKLSPKAEDPSSSHLQEKTRESSSSLAKNATLHASEKTPHTNVSDRVETSMLSTTNLKLTNGREYIEKEAQYSETQPQNEIINNEQNSSEIKQKDKQLDLKCSQNEELNDIAVESKNVKQQELQGKNKLARQKGATNTFDNNEGGSVGKESSAVYADKENKNKTDSAEIKKTVIGKTQLLNKTESTKTQLVKDGLNDKVTHNDNSDHTVATNHHNNDQEITGSSTRTITDEKVNSLSSIQTKTTGYRNASECRIQDKIKSRQEKVLSNYSKSEICTSVDKCLECPSATHARDKTSFRTENNITTAPKKVMGSFCITVTETKEVGNTNNRKSQTDDEGKLDTSGDMKQNGNIDSHCTKEHEKQQLNRATNDFKVEKNPATHCAQNVKEHKVDLLQSVQMNPQKWTNASTLKHEDCESSYKTKPPQVNTNIKIAESENKSLNRVSNRQKTNTDIAIEKNLLLSNRKTPGLPTGAVEQCNELGKANSNGSNELAKSDTTKTYQNMESSVHAHSKTANESVKRQDISKGPALITNVTKSTSCLTGLAAQPERCLPPGKSLSDKSQTHQSQGKTIDSRQGVKEIPATKLNVDTVLSDGTYQRADRGNIIPDVKSVKDAWHSISLSRNTKASGHIVTPIQIKEEPDKRHVENLKSIPKTHVPTATSHKIPEHTRTASTDKVSPNALQLITHTESSAQLGNTSVSTKQREQSVKQLLNARDPRRSRSDWTIDLKVSDNGKASTITGAKPIENKELNEKRRNGDNINVSSTCTDQSIKTTLSKVKADSLLAGNHLTNGVTVVTRNDKNTDPRNLIAIDSHVQCNDLETKYNSSTNPRQAEATVPSIPLTQMNNSGPDVEKRVSLQPVACTNYKELVGRKPSLQTIDDQMRCTNRRLDNDCRSVSSKLKSNTETIIVETKQQTTPPAVRQPVKIKREPSAHLSDALNDTRPHEPAIPARRTEEYLKQATVDTPKISGQIENNSTLKKGLTQGQCKNAILNTLNELSEVLQFLKDSKKGKDTADGKIVSSAKKVCSDSRENMMPNSERKTKTSSEDNADDVSNSGTHNASTRNRAKDVSVKDLSKSRTTPSHQLQENNPEAKSISLTVEPSVQTYHEEKKSKRGDKNDSVLPVKPKPTSHDLPAVSNIPCDDHRSSSRHHSDQHVKIKSEPVDTFPLESSTELEKDHHQIPVLCSSNDKSSPFPPISMNHHDTSINTDIFNYGLPPVSSTTGHANYSQQGTSSPCTGEGDGFSENSLVRSAETSQCIPVTFGNRELHTRQYQFGDGQYCSMQQTSVHSGQSQEILHHVRHNNDLNSPNKSGAYTYHKKSEFITSGNHKALETCHSTFSTCSHQLGYVSAQYVAEKCISNSDTLNNNDDVLENNMCTNRSSPDKPINERITQLSETSYFHTSGDQPQAEPVQEGQSTSVQSNHSPETRTSKGNHSSTGRKRPAPSDSDDEVVFSFHEVMRLKTVQYKKYRMGYTKNKLIDYREIRNNETPKLTNTRDEGDTNASKDKTSSKRSNTECNVDLRAVKHEINNSDEEVNTAANKKGKGRQRKKASRKKLKKHTTSDADKSIPVISTQSRWMNARTNQTFNKGGMGYFRWRNKYQSRPLPYKIDGDYFITKRGLRQTKDEFVRWTRFKERETIRKNIEAALHEYKKTFRAEDARNVDEKVASYLKSLTEPLSIQEEEEMNRRDSLIRRDQTHIDLPMVRFEDRGRGASPELRNRRQCNNPLMYRNTMARDTDWSNPLTGLLGGVLSAKLIEGLLKQNVAGNFVPFGDGVRDQLTRQLIGNLTKSSSTNQPFSALHTDSRGRYDKRAGQWQYNEKLDKYVYVTDDINTAFGNREDDRCRYRSSSPSENDDKHRRDYNDRHKTDRFQYRSSSPRENDTKRRRDRQKSDRCRYRSSSPRENNNKHRRGYNNRHKDDRCRYRSSSPRENDNKHRRDYNDRQKDDSCRHRSSSPIENDDKHRRDHNDRKKQISEIGRSRDKQENRHISSYNANDLHQKRDSGSIGQNEGSHRSRSRERNSNRRSYRNASPGSGTCEEYNGSWCSNNEDYSLWDHTANIKRSHRRSLSRELDCSSVDSKRQMSTSLARNSDTHGRKLVSSWNDEKYHGTELESSKQGRDTFKISRQVGGNAKRNEHSRRENDIDDREYEREKSFRSGIAVTCDDKDSHDRYEDDVVQTDAFRGRDDKRGYHSQNGLSRRQGMSYNESERSRRSVSDDDRHDYHMSRRERDDVAQRYNDEREDDFPRSRDFHEHNYDVTLDFDRFRYSRRYDDMHAPHAYTNKRNRAFDENVDKYHRRSHSNDDFDPASDKSWESDSNNRDDNWRLPNRDRRDDSGMTGGTNRERDIIPFRTDRFRSSASDTKDRRRRSSPGDEPQAELEYSRWPGNDQNSRNSSTDRDRYEFDKHRDRTSQSPMRRNGTRDSETRVFTDEFDAYQYRDEMTSDDYVTPMHNGQGRGRYDRKRHNYYPPRASATITKPPQTGSSEEVEYK